jgi:YD repeat-containing protein
MVLVGCNSENNSIENDLKEDNLKGEVVLVKYTTIDPGNVSLSEGFSLKIFNEMGMETKYFVGQPSKFFSLYESIYNNDRLVLLKKSFNWGRGLDNAETKYSYDPIGKLESHTDQSESTKYSYNEDGKLIKEVSSMDVLSSTKEYFYSDGKKDSTFFTLNNGGKVTYRTEKFGVNNSTWRSFSSEKTLTDIIYLSNNEKGDCVEKLYEEYDSKGNKIKTTTTKYEYNYDENGNWIQKRTIEEGKLKDTEYRTIVYKGGETGIYVDEMEKVILSLNVSGNQQNSNDNSSSTYSEQTERSSNNSSSNTYQQPERQQQPEKVKCYSCRGSGNCGKCSKTFSKPYYQGNGSYKWRNETKQGYTMCQDCFGRGHKQSHVVGGSGWEPNGDCYVRGCEDGWVNCRECNGSGNGTLLGKCRDCKGTGYRN